MKIGLLTFKSNKRLKASKANEHDQLIIAAAKRLGHEIKLIRADKCQVYCAPGIVKVLYNGKKFPKYEVIIPRVTLLKNVDIGSAIIKQLELSGFPIVNGFEAIVNAKNKLRTKQILIKNNIPVPKTIVVRRCEFLDEAVKLIGGLPLVLKLPQGSFGIGVTIMESLRSLQSALDIFWSSEDYNYVMMQEYIKDAFGKDIRVFIIGGKIIAAMQRTAKEGDFRSNISIGGTGTLVELTDEEKRIALKAAKVLKLQVAGVDLMRTSKGPLVIEVNSNPGLQGITEVTGLDVAAEIVKYAVKYAGMQKNLRGIKF